MFLPIKLLKTNGICFNITPGSCSDGLINPGTNTANLQELMKKNEKLKCLQELMKKNEELKCCTCPEGRITSLHWPTDMTKKLETP